MGRVMVSIDTTDLFWLCELLDDTAFMARLEQHIDASRIERVLKQLKGGTE